MVAEFPSATLPIPSRSEVFVTYLDYFRSRVIERIEELSDADVRASRLASGWTPLQLARHLAFVEMRWLEWGFEGRSVEEPWGDRRDDRWYVGEDVTREIVVGQLRAQGFRTRKIIRANALDTVAQPGPRFDDGAEVPTLERILFHVFQEYARHLGHLDIVAELAGAPTGE
jgi:uncharacterized damage-inducible protein DinB